jgi:hypothetical protein
LRKEEERRRKKKAEELPSGKVGIDQIYTQEEQSAR